MQVVSSSDGRFRAQYVTGSKTLEVLDANDHVLATLERDTYHTSSFCVVFQDVVSDGDEGAAPSTRLVFNPSFDGLSVYELPSMRRVFANVKKAEFLGEVLPIPAAADQEWAGRFYWAWSWGWGPMLRAVIYDMYEVAAHGTCACTWTCDTRADTAKLGYFMVSYDDYSCEVVPVACTSYDAANRCVHVAIMASLELRYGSDSDTESDANPAPDPDTSIHPSDEIHE